MSLLKGAKVKKRHTCKKKTTKAGTKLQKAQRANSHKLEYSVLHASLWAKQAPMIKLALHMSKPKVQIHKGAQRGSNHKLEHSVLHAIL